MQLNSYARIAIARSSTMCLCHLFGVCVCAIFLPLLSICEAAAFLLSLFCFGFARYFIVVVAILCVPFYYQPSHISRTVKTNKRDRSARPVYCMYANP